MSWIALAFEIVLVCKFAALEKYHPARTVFVFLRFFTNLTSIGLASLMTFAALRIAARRSLPSARPFAAMLVYVVVVSATYELMLRRTWSPRGFTLVLDAVVHDIVPASMLLFWLRYAPKRSLSWRDPIRWLAYPAAYIVVVFVMGGAGYGYPYAFLDVDRIGVSGAARVIVAFAAVFYGVGLGVVALARAMTRETKSLSPS